MDGDEQLCNVFGFTENICTLSFYIFSSNMTEKYYAMNVEVTGSMDVVSSYNIYKCNITINFNATIFLGCMYHRHKNRPLSDNPDDLNVYFLWKNHK